MRTATITKHIKLIEKGLDTMWKRVTAFRKHTERLEIKDLGKKIDWGVWQETNDREDTWLEARSAIGNMGHHLNQVDKSIDEAIEKLKKLGYW